MASEAVEAAYKLARQYYELVGQPGRCKVISRQWAYHGVTMGALSLTGVPAMKAPFEPMVPGTGKVPNAHFFRAVEHADDEQAHALWAADQVERAILMEGPDTSPRCSSVRRAGAERRRVHPAAPRLLHPAARDL